MTSSENTAVVDKVATVEGILNRAAEQLGDITSEVMGQFYHRFPESRELFQKHGGHGVANLEGEMVSQALYCLMWWFESQGEIEFLLEKSVPHHQAELEVPQELYLGFLTTTAGVIQSVIPAQAQQELAVWQELCCSLETVIAESAEL